ncbi:DUF1990 family protein [Isoptericola sp. NPDC057191]|uniref:DUF1990 family protein n=1 Tax=Isoptericola sp. NPDC057191 TaxID=3346041 RepID=UPI003635ABB5
MRITTTDDDETWFTLADGADRSTVEATVRAALVAQRDRLDRVEIDIVSDDDWPVAVLDAVRAAEARLSALRSRGISLTLDPRRDADFGLALTLAPFSIGCSGYDDGGGGPVWSVNDTGTSATFRLTAAEASAVRRAVHGGGGDTERLIPVATYHLGRRDLSYDVVGGTAPSDERWRPPDGWRAHERTVRLGDGADLWEDASRAVLSWGVKTRSGFAVDPPPEPGQVVRAGERFWLVARLGPLRVREPVQVVEVVTTGRRAALAYGTLEGHPVSGEEAFIVSRSDDGTVSLTLRSLTRAGSGRWRALFPLVLLLQRRYRRRYLRALTLGAR